MILTSICLKRQPKNPMKVYLLVEIIGRHFSISLVHLNFLKDVRLSITRQQTNIFSNYARNSRSIHEQSSKHFDWSRSLEQNWWTFETKQKMFVNMFWKEAQARTARGFLLVFVEGCQRSTFADILWITRFSFCKWCLWFVFRF